MNASKKSFSLEEFPNPKIIKNIFTHPDIYSTQRDLLKNYVKSFNGETVQVEYIKYNKYGRYFLKDSTKLSSTVMWNKIRSTLFNDSDLDIDIVNCHNELLLSILNPDIYDINHLKYYCENRQTVIDSIEIHDDAIDNYNKLNNDNKTKKDIVKSLFTIILYGGSIERWASTYLLEQPDYLLTDFVTNYINEIKMNANIIINDKKFKDIVKWLREDKLAKAKKKYLKNFDIEKFNIHPGIYLSAILQEYETLIIENSMEFMKSKNCIITSYNYDGFQIKKIDNIDEIINELNSFINTLCISHNKTHFFTFDRVTFIIKPFRDQLDTTKLLTLNSEYYERECMNKTVDYSLQKEYFEKFHMKILTPFCFIKILEDTNVFIKPTQISGMYQEIISENDKFITTWTLDPEMRCYESCNYYPIDSKCPKNTFNLWRAFPILSVKLDDTADTSIIHEHFNILFKHVKEVIDYVLDWLAHVVQKPDRKTEVCLILFGKQRTGKSTIGEYILRKIIGLDKMLVTSKTDKVFGRFANTQGKLLTVLNEASGAETFNISDILKDAVTCVSTEQERKGIDSVTITDYTNFIFTTNNLNSVKVPHDDSRFFAVEVSDEVQANAVYFNKLYKVLDDDLVMRKFYQELMDRPISDFRPSNDRPMTDLYQDMKEMNKDPMEDFILFWRYNLQLILDKKDCECVVSQKMTASKLYEAFNCFWKLQGRSNDSKPTLTKFGIRIKQFTDDVTSKKGKYCNEYSLIPC